MSILVLRSSWWGREKAVCLLSLSCLCLVIVVWLFLSVPWVCLQFVIVILTYYFGVSFMRTGMALAIYTFAWSSLSLRHSSKFSCGDSNGDWMQFCAISEGSGKSAHLHRLTLSFVTVQNLFCCLKWRFVCYSRQQRILWWVCTFAQAVTGQCNTYQDLLCSQKRLWTFAQARLSLLHSIEISCADWNGDFCYVYVSSEWCGESAPATIWLLCNHQCVVSMRQKCSQCVVIKFLNKTLASLPRRTYKVVIVFWMLLHGNMTTAALRHAYSPQ